MFPVATMCRVLRISRSGYYASAKRHHCVQHAMQRSRPKYERAMRDLMGRTEYGAPRIWEDLREAGEHVGQKRVARLMRAAGIVGVHRRRSVHTTRRGAAEVEADDLVKRDFKANAPNELWVADITYVPTWAGFLYLSVVLDAFSRRIVGWAMATHLRTELVLNALNMALQQRRPSSVIHHSDHGSQYTALAFGQRCGAMGVRPSRGTVGDAYDNAMAESFFATLECELLDRRTFHSQAEARIAIFRYIEGWYNPHRRHSAIGQMSPVTYERVTANAASHLTSNAA